jgi:hypothetical protein
MIPEASDETIDIGASNTPVATMARPDPADDDSADEYLLNDIGVALRLISERM